MRLFYGVLCVLGTVLPYSQFAPWLTEHGLAFGRLWQEATANRVGAFAWADVLVSATTLLVFIFAESRRLKLRYRWVPVVATFIIGPSLGLPLFLWLRQPHIEQRGVKQRA